MSTNACWELTCNGLVSHPGGKDCHTTETKDKCRYLKSHLAQIGFTVALVIVVVRSRNNMKSRVYNNDKKRKTDNVMIKLYLYRKKTNYLFQ